MLVRLVQTVKSRTSWAICIFFSFWNGILTTKIWHHFCLQSTKNYGWIRQNLLTTVIRWAHSKNVQGTLSQCIACFERLFGRYFAVWDCVTFVVCLLSYCSSYLCVCKLLASVQSQQMAAVSLNTKERLPMETYLHVLLITQSNQHFLIYISPGCLTEIQEIGTKREHFLLKWENQH